MEISLLLLEHQDGTSKRSIASNSGRSRRCTTNDIGGGVQLYTWNPRHPQQDTTQAAEGDLTQ